MVVQVIEVLAIPAKEDVVNDIDKLMMTLFIDNEERKVTIPYQEFHTEAQFKAVLKQAVSKVKPKLQIRNLSEEWKGEYEI